jgi:hypothetical protein
MAGGAGTGPTTGTMFLIAASITVMPGMPSTVCSVPLCWMKVIFAMSRPLTRVRFTERYIGYKELKGKPASRKVAVPSHQIH